MRLRAGWSVSGARLAAASSWIAIVARLGGLDTACSSHRYSICEVTSHLTGMLYRTIRMMEAGIKPVFVFEGIVPPLQSQAFQLNAIHGQLDAAWTHIAKDARHEAQKVFAVSTSRINADIEHIVFHHLKALGIEVMRAPYFVGAQLMHLAETGFVHAVVGVPSGTPGSYVASPRGTASEMLLAWAAAEDPRQLASRQRD